MLTLHGCGLSCVPKARESVMFNPKFLRETENNLLIRIDFLAKLFSITWLHAKELESPLLKRVQLGELVENGALSVGLNSATVPTAGPHLF